MTPPKGAALEELVRAFYSRQGFIALRGVSIRFEDEDVTDVDVWLYGRQGGATRTRAIVDVKDKRSPKAFERILWTRGMQLALGVDRAIVATTDGSPKVRRFSQQQNVTILPATLLKQTLAPQDATERLSLEEFLANINKYPNQKQDGDWVRQISQAKSAVVSLQPYPAFNKAISTFRFFAERAATRPHHREQALRGAYLAGGLASIALDSALERIAFEEPVVQYQQLIDGITYGDGGDGRVRNSIETVLSVITNGIENGRVIARQTSDALNALFSSLRADIIAEYFVKGNNAAQLFSIARELEARAHMVNRGDLVDLSVGAKSVIGLFADFVNVKRPALLSSDFATAAVSTTASSSPRPSRTGDSSASAGATNRTDDVGKGLFDE